MKQQEVKVGLKVAYLFPFNEDGTFNKNEEIETVITELPWELCKGHYSCKILGIENGVSIKRLRALTNER